MNKQFLLIGLTLALSMSAFAGQVKREVISSDYSRNSVSKIAIVYDDQWNRETSQGFDAIDFGAKFDQNQLQTKTIQLRGAARTTGNTSAQTDINTRTLLTNYINQHNIGKEIFDYILMVDQNGRFHYDRMVARSRWNANDEDVKLDNASQVKTMDENGPALLKNSYIVVYDAKETRVEQKTKDNGEKVNEYKAVVSAYVYKIDNADEVINNILHNMWIYDTDDAATVAAKREAYNKVRIPMRCVTSQAVTVSSEKSMHEAIAGSYENLLSKMENNIAAWEVKITPEQVRPYITAKIGKKEGLKNGQRFKILKNKGDEDKGDLRTVKVGYARVTTVADNNSVATGNTATSSLYQISGKYLKGTEFLKQSNDIKLGLSIDYNYNGLGWDNQNVFGAFSMVDLTLDYLMHIQRNGISHYARVNFGYDIATSKMLRNGYKGQHNGDEYGAKNYVDHDEWLKDGVSFFNISIGYMVGLKAKQVFELQPMFNVGVDLPICHAKDAMSSDEKKSNFGVFIDPAVRLVFNCGYPFQIFFQTDYCVTVYQGGTYKKLNDKLGECGHKRNHGLGVAAGVKWTF